MLRDAAVTKSHMILADIMNTAGNEKDPAGVLTSILSAVVAICRTGVDDKNSQVNFGAFDLLDEIIAHMNACKIPRTVALNAFDGVTFLQLLIEKLADGNQRVREGTHKSLLVLSTSTLLTLATKYASSLSVKRNIL